MTSDVNLYFRKLAPAESDTERCYWAARRRSSERLEPNASIVDCHMIDLLVQWQTAALLMSGKWNGGVVSGR